MVHINYQSVENLLKEYKALTALVESLKIELQLAYVKGAQEDDNEVIYALVLGNRKIDDMPRAANVISDKTFNVAISYRQSMKNSNYNEIKRLSQEILAISVVLEKIDVAINALTESEVSLIKSIYFECKSWHEIARNDQEELKLKRDRKEILEKMAKIIRLPEEMYLDVIGMVRA